MPEVYDWTRRFAYLPTPLSDDTWAWWCWIEVKIDYRRSYLVQRRLAEVQ